MNVFITFEPSGINGVVAEGTYLIDAARRLGVPLGSGCSRGKQGCPSCLVLVKAGGELLSTPSSVEERILGMTGIDESYRLVCQTKIEHPGELVVLISSRKFAASTGAPSESDVRKKFDELPLNKKIATLLQLEAITMSQAFDAAIEKPMALGTRAFDALVKRTQKSRPTQNPPEEKSPQT